MTIRIRSSMKIFNEQHTTKTEESGTKVPDKYNFISSISSTGLKKYGKEEEYTDIDLETLWKTR